MLNGIIFSSIVDDKMKRLKYF